MSRQTDKTSRTDASATGQPRAKGLAGTEFSVRKGISLHFHDPETGMDLTVWGSAWTGREIITVNGQTVSDVYSFAFQTPHYFEVDDEVYEALVNIHMVRGALSVMVMKGDEVLFRGESKAQEKPSWMSGWKGLAVGLCIGALGGLVGYSAASLFTG